MLILGEKTCHLLQFVIFSKDCFLLVLDIEAQFYAKMEKLFPGENQLI